MPGTLHPQRERAHGEGFGERCKSALAQRHTHHGQADDVVSGIAQEVEGIS
jgi:hypothetical protein